MLLAACLLQAGMLRSQCIAKDSLLHRIAQLKSNPAFTAADQLKELLRYEAGMAQCPYRNDSTHEILLRRITGLYRQQSDYAHAAFYLNKACNLIAANYSSLEINRPQIVTNYYFLSVYYDSLRNVTEKRKAENNCFEWALRQHIPSDISAIRSLFAKVEYMFDIGDYQQCLENAQLCEGLSRQYLATPGSNALTGEGFARSSHGWCVESLLRLHDFETAEKMLTNKAA